MHATRTGPTMINTWLHSAGVVVVATPCIAALHAGAIRAATLVSPGAPPAWHVEPAFALAGLAPGLVLGWFTRRHPLVVGGIAGALGVLACNAFVVSMASRSALGDTLSTALLVSVAALAGRALRFRFRSQIGVES